MKEVDQTAFVTRITEIQRDLYAYVLTLVGNPNDADDILQEANRVLWEKREEFQPGTQFRAWAYTIAHYQVLAFRKSKGGERLLFDESLISRMGSEVPSGLDGAGDHLQALRKCLGALSAEDHRLLDLRYVSEIPAPQLARQLDRSPGAVRQALFRIRHGLVECIERRLRAEERR